jgi:hypothetical protein
MARPRRQTTAPLSAPVERPETGRATASDLTPSWFTTWWPVVLMGMVMVVHAVALLPELATDVPTRNDSMFHLLMVRGASEALAAGNNPLDFWIPQLELGFPQFLYYQHLPHLLLALIHRACFGLVSVETLFHGFRYLLLVGMPLTVLWSMRRMGFSLVASAIGGAASMLFVADNRMGLEYNSYVARGYGLFSQLVAIHLTFVTLATLTVTLREGRGYAAAALSLAALVLSHLLFGVIIAVMSVLLWLLGDHPRAWGPRLVRLAVVGAIAGVVASYMLIPFVLSSKAWLSTMPWLKQGGSRSGRVVEQVVSGGLFDLGRLPVLTFLVVAGAVAAAFTRDARSRFATVGLAVCLALYLVRPDTAGLGQLLPAHSGFVSYRFLSAIGVLAVLVMGIGADALWRLLARVPALRGTVGAVVGLVAFGLLLTPALVERWGYYRDQRDVVEESRAALAAAPGLAEVLARVDARDGGRVYAGPVTTRSCPMRVGPGLCVSDLLNARGVSTVGNPMQGLSLPAGLIKEIPAGNPAMYDLFDVRTVVIGSDRVVPSFLQPVLKAGDYALYAVPTSGFAQYVGVNGRRATNRQDTLYFAHDAWVRAGGPASHMVTRWDYRAPLASPAPRALCPGNPRTVREVVSSQSVIVDVACAAPTGDTLAVALKMAYHPHWEVTVDGTAVQPYMVSPGFLAVDVTPGAHRIEARYRAHPAKLPLLLLGLVVLGAVALLRDRMDAPAQWWLRRVV